MRRPPEVGHRFLDASPAVQGDAPVVVGLGVVRVDPQRPPGSGRSPPRCAPGPAGRGPGRCWALGLLRRFRHGVLPDGQRRSVILIAPRRHGRQRDDQRQRHGSSSPTPAAAIGRATARAARRHATTPRTITAASGRYMRCSKTEIVERHEAGGRREDQEEPRPDEAQRRPPPPRQGGQQQQSADDDQGRQGVRDRSGDRPAGSVVQAEPVRPQRQPQVMQDHARLCQQIRPGR